MQTEITFNYIDIAAYNGENREPEELLARTEGGIWFYISKPINKDEPEWRSILVGPKVRVPLFPYCSVGQDAEHVIAHAFSLGLLACNALNNRGKYTVHQFHLSIGVPVEALEDYYELNNIKVSCYRYWLGLAAHVF